MGASVVDQLEIEKNCSGTEAGKSKAETELIDWPSPSSSAVDLMIGLRISPLAQLAHHFANRATGNWKLQPAPEAMPPHVFIRPPPSPPKDA